MPKLKTTREEKENQRIIRAIGGGIAATRVSREALARSADITRQTLCDRMKDPGEFRLRELREIARKLKLDVSVLVSDVL